MRLCHRKWRRSGPSPVPHPWLQAGRAEGLALTPGCCQSAPGGRGAGPLPPGRRPRAPEAEERGLPSPGDRSGWTWLLPASSRSRLLSTRPGFACTRRDSPPPGSEKGVPASLSPGPCTSPCADTFPVPPPLCSLPCCLCHCLGTPRGLEAVTSAWDQSSPCENPALPPEVCSEHLGKLQGTLRRGPAGGKPHPQLSQTTTSSSRKPSGPLTFPLRGPLFIPGTRPKWVP